MDVCCLSVYLSGSGRCLSILCDTVHLFYLKVILLYVSVTTLVLYREICPVYQKLTLKHLNVLCAMCAPLWAKHSSAFIFYDHQICFANSCHTLLLVYCSSIVCMSGLFSPIIASAFCCILMFNIIPNFEICVLLKQNKFWF